MVILDISLGTSSTGVAVMSGGQLIFWHTHSFRDTWSDDKAILITARYERYVKQYRPHVTIIKTPPAHHHSEAFKHLLQKVAALFQYHGCMVTYTTKEEVKADTVHIKNHQQLMGHVIELYPILVPEYRKAVAGKNRYHAKLFDAVMVAHWGKHIERTKAERGTGLHSP